MLCMWKDKARVLGMPREKRKEENLTFQKHREGMLK
jgi:hypothetical protein